MRLLSLFLLLLSLNNPLRASGVPDAYADFNHKDIIPFSLSTEKSGHLSIDLKGQTIQLPINTVKSGATTQSFQHTFDQGEINATLGGGGLFGQLRLQNKFYTLTTECRSWFYRGCF